jgi:hypothetical protein
MTDDPTERCIRDLTATREYEVQITVKLRTMGPSKCSQTCPQLSYTGYESECRLDRSVLSTNRYMVDRSAYCRQLVRAQNAQPREVK